MTDNILQTIWQNLQKSPKSDFLILPDRSITRGVFRHLVGHFMGHFDQHDLTVGDRVLIVTDNELAAISAFVAAMLDGLVPVQASPDASTDRLAAISGTLEPALVLIDEQRAGEDWLAGSTVSPVARAGAPVRQFLPFRKKPDAAALTGIETNTVRGTPRLPGGDDDLCYIVFTSGTTSAPAGVMISRRNIAAQLATLANVFHCGPDTRLFNDLRVTHVDGLVQGPLLALYCGGCVIRSGGFAVHRVEEWLNRIRQQRATHLVTVPTMLRMIDQYAAHDDYFDAPEFRCVMSSAESLPADFWQHMEQRFGIRVCNSYGMTETVSCATYTGLGDPRPPLGSIGYAVDCQARLMPQDGADDDGSGELQLTGDNISPGYWRDGDRTRQSRTGDGWLRTGDIARQNDDGSFTILGRLKTAINSGGFLIRPEEIDEVMMRLPDVAESVTVGLPDPVFGEVPVTAIVASEEVAETALAAHAGAFLEDFKQPRKFVVLDHIPRGDAGKPQRQKLSEMVFAALGDGKSDGEGGGSDSDQELSTRIQQIAAENFRLEPGRITASTMVDDLPEWDSFSHLTLILAVEAQFGVQIPAARVASLRGIGELIREVEALRT